MKIYELDQTLNYLSGCSVEQFTVYNQYAAVALDKFHKGSKAQINFNLDNTDSNAILEWNSKFPKGGMKEDTEIANFGGVALAFFVMSVLSGYGYVEQTEIGDGVDYAFRITEPKDDDLNFLDDSHYVEISGILEEKGGNTLKKRIKSKHNQINRGRKSSKSSSVIVTLFSEPKSVREIHI